MYKHREAGEDGKYYNIEYWFECNNCREDWREDDIFPDYEDGNYTPTCPRCGTEDVTITGIMEV